MAATDRLGHKQILTASAPERRTVPTPEENSMAEETMLRLEGVHLSYGSLAALSDVSLKLNKSEIFVLMGPNGAGKSSLVKVLTGALLAGEGEVIMLGALNRSKRAISLVPQEIALYSWLTARENCLAFARIGGAGLSEARHLTERALALTQCEDVAHTPVARLSGGYKRRINIAAALASEPAMLILDEPTVGVDLDAKRAIWRTLLTLKELGTGIVVVTHDFGEADALADRVGFLDGGRLVRQGKPSALLAELLGGKKAIELVLADAPDASQAELLKSLGLIPTEINMVWTAFHDMQGWDVGGFAASFTARGFVIRELRLRDPDIEVLYTQYCKNESHK